MDKVLSEIDPDAGAAGAEQPGDDFEELLRSGEADVQSLTVTCGIGSVSTVLYPTHGLVVLLAATAGGDEKRKTAIITGGLEYFDGEGMETGETTTAFTGDLGEGEVF
jgi:hypothetical protein